ncbi:MAG: class I SAM-dependent methyltransferase [Paludibacteraceae bacterium]|nr:class I SAM-dependent methyltransferase [Paludibacteraceae bacterium]
MSFLTPSIVSFIKEHASDDVRKLALCKCDLSGNELKTALQQIEGLQKTKQKLPSWAANEKVVYPVHLSLEQCSSEATARFKAQLVTDGDIMADLTGGFGIDFTFISKHFKQADYVETNEALCKIAENNLHAFGLTNWQVFNTDAESYLKQHNGQRFDLLFVDPARRDANGRKTVAPSDCTPDLTLLQDVFRLSARKVMVKYSPMLDIGTAIKELRNIESIYTISVANECKELLIIQNFEADVCSDIQISCVNIKPTTTDVFETSLNNEKEATVTIATSIGQFLYEPNSSIMKAGAFKSICKAWGIEPLQQNSHLYTSQTLKPEVQGRAFEVIGTCRINAADFNKTFPDTKKANLTIRNCPLRQEDIRKKLKIKEGGDLYLFATTLINKELVLIGCKKVRNSMTDSAL